MVSYIKWVKEKFPKASITLDNGNYQVKVESNGKVEVLSDAGSEKLAWQDAYVKTLFCGESK